MDSGFWGLGSTLRVNALGVCYKDGPQNFGVHTLECGMWQLVRLGPAVMARRRKGSNTLGSGGHLKIEGSRQAEACLPGFFWAGFRLGSRV